MNGLGKCLKIGQVMRLRQIARTWRKLASTRKAVTAVASKLLCSLSSRVYYVFYNTHVDVSGVKNSNNGRRRPLSAVPPDVPPGHMAVHVGHQCRKRFVIRTAYLDHPMFRALLRQAEEDFGYGQQGVLAIPCDELLFEHILCFVRRQRSKRSIDRLGFL